MKNSKRVIAGAMALLSAVSVASCGSSSMAAIQAVLMLIR